MSTHLICLTCPCVALGRGEPQALVFYDNARVFLFHFVGQDF